MAEDTGRYRSHLFTVRIWAEETGRGRVEWRGRVKYVMSGETRYFRQWSDLVEFMSRQLPEGAAGHKLSDYNGA